jgi:hypothetical protein
MLHHQQSSYFVKRERKPHRPFCIGTYLAYLPTFKTVSATLST